MSIVGEIFNHAVRCAEPERVVIPLDFLHDSAAIRQVGLIVNRGKPVAADNSVEFLVRFLLDFRTPTDMCSKPLNQTGRLKQIINDTFWD